MAADNAAYLHTFQRYKFKPTLWFRWTYFRLLMLKWGQLHIWDPDSKTSPLVESSQSVSVGSSPNQLRIWSSVCGPNKCSQCAFYLVMQRLASCSIKLNVNDAHVNIFSLKVSLENFTGNSLFQIHLEVIYFRFNCSGKGYFGAFLANTI